MKKLLSLIIGLLLLTLTNSALADDFVPVDEDYNSSNTLILDADDTGGDVTLQFGTTLGETFEWNSTSLNFDLSDSLDLNQNEIKDVALDNLASAPGSPVAGQIYHNTTDNNTYVWNGTAWEDITGAGGGGAPLSKLFQGDDEYGGLQITNVSQVIPLEEEHIKDDYYTHSTITNPGEVTVLTEGWYKIDARTTIGAIDTLAGVRGNPVLEIEVDSGSGFTALSIYTGGYVRENANPLSTNISMRHLHYFNANDIVRMVVRDTIATEPNEETIAEGSTLILEYIDRSGTGGSTVNNLKDVGDVDAPAPSDGEVLTFDSADSKWKPEVVSGGGHTQNTDTGSTTETFTLDSDNTGGDVTLSFGTTLAETLTWDNTNTRFTFSNALRAEGNLAVLGEVYIAANHTATDSNGILNLGRNSSNWENLSWADINDQFELSDDLSLGQAQLKDAAIDNLASAPGSPVAGQIYHNTTDNNTYVWNGTTWEDITGAGGAASDLPVVQTRRTTNYTTTDTFVDITFDTTDVENDATAIEHDNTNTDNINILQDGIYMITYRATMDPTDGFSLIEGYGRLRLNDTSVIAGSETIDKWYTGASIMTATTYASLTNGDYVTLQLSKETTGTALVAASDIVLSVSKLDGIAGADGTDGAQGIPGSGSSITLEDEGVSVNNTPHTTLDFVGTGVTVTDAGSGEATVTIDGGTDGWHGSTARIKITPMDFQSDDGPDSNTMDPSGRYITEYGTSSPVATIAIPTGFQATHVMIYGSDTGNTVSVYANDIADNTTATSLGSGNVGTEINITDSTSTTTNYITVSIDYGNADQIYGGYITISTP